MSEVVDFPIQPLFDNVFVRKDNNDTTKSGLHLPQTVAGRAVFGTVIAVGPGHLNVEQGNFVPCSVKKGDRVYLKEFSGSIIKYEGIELFVFHEAEILGVMKDPNAGT